MPNVRIVAAGDASVNQGRLVVAERGVIVDARQLADIVLVDSAPLLEAHAPTELLAEADALLIVCRSGQTSVQAAERATQLLQRVSAPAVGVAIIGARGVKTAGTYRREEERSAVKRTPARRRTSSRA